MPYQGRISAKRISLVYLVLAIIFFTPIFLAWYLFSQKETLIIKTTHHGYLIRPPFSINELSIYDEKGRLLNNNRNRISAMQKLSIPRKWILLLIVPDHCKQLCERGLYKMRQVRLATGAQRRRLERAVLTFSSIERHSRLEKLLETAYVGTLYFRANRSQFLEVFKEHVKNGNALKQGALYVLDPLGNVIMNYKPNVNPTNVFKDIQRLLRVSQIG